MPKGGIQAGLKPEIVVVKGFVMAEPVASVPEAFADHHVSAADVVGCRLAHHLAAFVVAAAAIIVAVGRSVNLMEVRVTTLRWRSVAPS
jgi:hypothetical protein